MKNQLLYIEDLTLTRKPLLHKQQSVAVHENKINYLEKQYKISGNMSTVKSVLFYSHCSNLPNNASKKMFWRVFSSGKWVYPGQLKKNSNVSSLEHSKEK